MAGHYQEANVCAEVLGEYLKTKSGGQQHTAHPEWNAIYIEPKASVDGPYPARDSSRRRRDLTSPANPANAMINVDGSGT